MFSFRLIALIRWISVKVETLRIDLRRDYFLHKLNFLRKEYLLRFRNAEEMSLFAQHHLPSIKNLEEFCPLNYFIYCRDEGGVRYFFHASDRMLEDDFDDVDLLTLIFHRLFHGGRLNPKLLVD